MKTWILFAMLALVTTSCSQDADRAPGQDSAGAGGADLLLADLTVELDLDALVCAVVTSRDTVAGRTVGLKCY